MTLNEFILAFAAAAPDLKGRCFYCGLQTNKSGKEHYFYFQTKDHVIPNSVKDRTRFAQRMVVCCRKCNAIKEDLTMQEFKIRTGLTTFFAEEYLGVKIEDLEDIELITAHILNYRKVTGRCIKFNGKPQAQFRITLHQMTEVTAKTLTIDASPSNDGTFHPVERGML